MSFFLLVFTLIHSLADSCTNDQMNEQIALSLSRPLASSLISLSLKSQSRSLLHRLPQNYRQQITQPRQLIISNIDNYAPKCLQLQQTSVLMPDRIFSRLCHFKSHVNDATCQYCDLRPKQGLQDLRVNFLAPGELRFLHAMTFRIDDKRYRGHLRVVDESRRPPLLGGLWRRMFADRLVLASKRDIIVVLL